ncbi:MAG: hypothetical protein N2484_00475, partial [Clostridia bacterium]|nr:hypothetical protein [Clostridia bacterium]
MCIRDRADRWVRVEQNYIILISFTIYYLILLNTNYSFNVLFLDGKPATGLTEKHVLFIAFTKRV